MKVSIETITPETATALLETNVKNRHLSPFWVDRFAQDMTEGRWLANGQGVVVSDKGKLLDGQHRMAAIVKSGKAQDFVVTRDVDEAAFTSMDSGRARSVRDVLSAEGMGETRASTIGAAGRLAYAYVGGVVLKHTPSRQTLLSFIDAHPSIRESADLIGVNNYRFPRGPVTGVIALANARHEYDSEAQEFVTGLQTGAGLFKGDPRLALREWIMQNRLTGKMASGDRTFVAAVRAWNAFVVGRELSVIKMVEGQTRATLPITGFHGEDWADVPDLATRAAENIRNASKRTVGDRIRRNGRFVKPSEAVAQA